MYKFSVGDVKEIDVNRIIEENLDTDAIVLADGKSRFCTVLIRRSFVARFNAQDNVKIGYTVLKHGVGNTLLEPIQVGKRNVLWLACDCKINLPEGWVALDAETVYVGDQIKYAQNYKRKIWVSVEPFVSATIEDNQ